jgi:hypothetical protein
MGQTSPVSISDAGASGDVTAAVGSGRGYVGGLIGEIRNAKSVTNVSASGQVNVSANDVANGEYVGGLIGVIDHESGANIVANASATGDVNADAAGPTGGLIGGTDGTLGTVQDSYAQGNVSGRNGPVGGLIGQTNGDTARVYASGRVEGNSGLGGLIGDNSGQISESYWDKGATNQRVAVGSGSSEGATGFGTVGDDTRALEMQGRAPTTFMAAFDYTSPWKLTSTYPVFQRESNTSGSLVAPVDTIEATDATAVQTQQITVEVNATTGGSRVGPGYTVNISNADDLTELKGETALTDANGTATFTFTELNTGTFEPEFEAVSNSAASVTATVTVESGVVRTYIREDGTELTAVYRGNGTVNSPYEIDSLADLQAIDNSTTAHDNQYTLVANIDASATIESWNGGSGFEAIASATDEAFTGTLDGNGHTISNLSVDRSGANRAGLVGNLGSDGTIQNLTIQNASPATTTSEPQSGPAPVPSRASPPRERSTETIGLVASSAKLSLMVLLLARLHP